MASKKQAEPTIEEMEAELNAKMAELKQAKADAKASAKLAKNSKSIERTKGLVAKATEAADYAADRANHWRNMEELEINKLRTYAERLVKLGVDHAEVAEITGILVSEPETHDDEPAQPELPIED